jgi:hypothetical protein
VSLSLEAITRIQLGKRRRQWVCMVEGGGPTLTIRSHDVDDIDHSATWGRLVRWICARTASQGTRHEVLDGPTGMTARMLGRATFDPHDIPVSLCPPAPMEELSDSWVDNFEAASERFETRGKPISIGAAVPLNRGAIDAVRRRESLLCRGPVREEDRLGP